MPPHLEGEELQIFVSSHARPHWATGGGIIEAAEMIVARAQENANIEGYHHATTH